jgi:hypothetical protein
MATDISEDMEVSAGEPVETIEDSAVDDGFPQIPVEEVQETHSDSAGPSLSQQVSELGFTDVADDADARYRLLEHYQQLQDANNQWSEYNQQQQQQYQQYQQQKQQQEQYRQQQYQQQQYNAQQQALQQQAQPEEPTGPVQDITGVAHWWNPPGTTLEELEQHRENKVHPETGEIYTDWKEGTPAEIMQGAETHVGYLEQWANDIIRNPQKVLPNIIEQEFDKLFADRYSALIAYNNQQTAQTQQQQYQQQYGEYKEQTIQDITSRNADWLYQANPMDNQPLRDNFGQLVLSPQGEAVTKYINYFRGMGIDDPAKLWDLATRMYSGDISTAEPQVQQQQVGHVQQQVQQPPVGDTLRQATHIPSAGGSVPSGSNPSPYSQNPHGSAGDKLRQQALTDGLF